MDQTVRVVVHPIDTEAHPTVPAGWRWAVMIGGASPTELEGCANAAWAPNRAEAEVEGEHAAITAVKTARMLGVHAEWAGVTVLDGDPIPAENDPVTII